MKRRTQAASSRQKSRGVALVTTLLLLMVFMGMTLAIETFFPLVLLGVALQRLQRRVQV